MNLHFSAEDEAFRTEVRAWLEANLALGLRDPEQGPAIRDMMKRLLVD